VKTLDLDKLRSEEQRTLGNFCEQYNKDLPESFTRATEELLMEYRRTHPEAFRTTKSWSLDQHRKKVMDWLPMQSSRTII
jgi:hypothetical protein